MTVPTSVPAPSSEKQQQAYYPPPTAAVATQPQPYHSQAPPPYSSDSIPTGPKELGVYCASTFLADAVIKSADKSQELYYVVSSQWSSSRPDVTVHLGPGAGPTVVGAAMFHTFSGRIDVSFGDPRSSAAGWENMERDGIFSLTRSFAYDGIDAQTGLVRRKMFTWKRTSEGGNGSLKLVDDETREVVALFLRPGLSFKKWGRFVFNTEWGPQWEAAVVTTGMALLVWTRRQSRSGAAGGAGS